MDESRTYVILKIAENFLNKMIENGLLTRKERREIDRQNVKYITNLSENFVGIYE